MEYILKFVDNMEGSIKFKEENLRNKVVRVYDKLGLDIIREHALKAKANGYDSFGIHISEMDISTRAVIRATLADIYSNVSFHLKEDAQTSTSNVPAPAPTTTIINKDIYIITPYTIISFKGDELSDQMKAFYDEVWSFIKDANNVRINLLSASNLRSHEDDDLIPLVFEWTKEFLNKHFINSSMCMVYNKLNTDDSCISRNASQLKTAAINNAMIGASDAWRTISHSGGGADIDKIRANFRVIEDVAIPQTAVAPYLFPISEEMDDMYNENQKPTVSSFTRKEEYMLGIMKLYTNVKEKNKCSSNDDMLSALKINRDKTHPYKDPAYRNTLPQKDDYSSYWGNTDIGKMHKKAFDAAYGNDEVAKGVWDDIGATFNKKNSEGKRAIDAATEKVYNAKHILNDVMGIKDDSDEIRYDYRTYENPDMKEKGVASIEKFKVQKQINDNIKEIDRLEKEIVSKDVAVKEDREEIVELRDQIEELNQENKNLQTELSASVRDEVTKAKIEGAIGESQNDDDELNAPNKWDELGDETSIGIMRNSEAYVNFDRLWLSRQWS